MDFQVRTSLLCINNIAGAMKTVDVNAIFIREEAKQDRDTHRSHKTKLPQVARIYLHM